MQLEAKNILYRGVHLLLISLLLSSVFTASEGPMCSCQNYGACDFTNQDEFKVLGKRNVALGKPAKMSSLWNSTTFDAVSGPPCLAVNGNRNTNFRQINRFPDSPNCIHTGEGDCAPYWEVDLGEPYLIASITIYWRNEYAERGEGVSVTVDGQLCHIFQHPVSNPSNITCGTPPTGQTVRLSKHDNRTTQFYFLNVCEVEVWGEESQHLMDVSGLHLHESSHVKSFTLKTN